MVTYRYVPKEIKINKKGWIKYKNKYELNVYIPNAVDTDWIILDKEDNILSLDIKIIGKDNILITSEKRLNIILKYKHREFISNNEMVKSVSDTKIELLTNDEGEYINLKKKIGDKWIETSFYIDGMNFKMREDQIYATLHGDTFAIPNSIWSVEFKCKKNDDGNVVNMTTIQKEMTKEEIEKELGYKIKIIN